MDDVNLAELYRNRFSTEILPRKNAIWRVICRNFLSSYIKASDFVVDVACGYGEFINNIDAGKKVAIDLNPDTRDFLDSEVDFHQCLATELSTVVDGNADVVFTSNFLEHLPNKQVLDVFLDQVFKALKPGGRYIIVGPNLRYLPGAYWDYYDHHLGLTHHSLTEALQLKGFVIEKCVPKFLPYTIRGSLPTHPLFVWLYLKMPLAWKVLGKQFFIVARKK
ncbi:Methyltransferase type 11 [candidate division TM7 genomosp. GTL1]|nr:Methyltransferase type 11 [candidate division TM7 genomosp. GTL1]